MSSRNFPSSNVLLVPTFILPQVKLLNSLGIKELILDEMEWIERSKGQYSFIDSEDLVILEDIKNLSIYIEPKSRNTYIKWT